MARLAEVTVRKSECPILHSLKKLFYTTILHLRTQESEEYLNVFDTKFLEGLQGTLTHAQHSVTIDRNVTIKEVNNIFLLRSSS